MLGHHWYDRETPFKWRFAGRPMLARLWLYLDRLSLHQLRKKNVVKVYVFYYWLLLIRAKCANSSEPSLRSALRCTCMTIEQN